MSLLISLVLGLGLSLVIGVFAYRRGSLTRSGVLGAVLTGTAIFGFGGFVPGLLLIAFFVSSTVLSQYQARVKAQFSEKFQKGSRRDLGQALANGGWAALLAVGYGLAEWNQADERAAIFFFAAFVGTMATVTADTWATEIGVLSKTAPRMITTGRIVPTGTSGGVTLLGTVAAFAGGLFIGVVALLSTVVANVALFLYAQVPVIWDEYLLVHLREVISNSISFGIGYVAIACLGGLAGALFDSLLGATVQAIYFCEYDETQTETKIHTCGRATRLVRGQQWLDNDGVNFAAAVFGSLVAVVLANFVL
jgi:uncharacterized protein (TIGR00297 family)